MDESKWNSAYVSPQGSRAAPDAAAVEKSSGRSIIRRAIVVGSAQAAVWIGIGIAVVQVGNRCEKVLRDFKQDLLVMSKIAFGLNHVLYDYWYLLSPLVLIWPLLNYGVALATRFKSGPTLRCVWYVLTWLTPALALVFFLLAYLIPFVSLFSQLQAR
ncbi:MAG TPA: hypothetical protein VG056_09265 [Pirellulales bacterium]|jgi:hypothetical protein|nr:hypothetical protein [Pirellulales bacterium]